MHSDSGLIVQVKICLVCWLVCDCRAAEDAGGKQEGELAPRFWKIQPEYRGLIGFAASTSESRTICSTQSRCKGLVSSLSNPLPSQGLDLFFMFSYFSVDAFLLIPLFIPWPPITSSLPHVILHLILVTCELKLPSTNQCHDAHRWQLPVVLPSEWWTHIQTQNSWWGMPFHQAFALSFSGLSC